MGAARMHEKYPAGLIFITIYCYAYRKLRASDVGQMLLNISVAMICHHSALNLQMLESSHCIVPLCFVTQLFQGFFGLFVPDYS